MWINSAILFITAFAAGIAALYTPTIKTLNFKLALIFAGSYLFSITILHIIPGLFFHAFDPSLIALFLLAGFFLQFFLELFTSGVEHGHLHQSNGHEHSGHTPLFLLGGLCFHSLMEGALLAQPSTIHEHEFPTGLLLGIILHKMPAAFALMSILIHRLGKKSVAVVYLIIFASASPLGLIFSDYLASANLISSNVTAIIFAVVSGSFLKISTTILFESDPHHRFNWHKMIVSGIGAAAAILVEFAIH